MDMPRYEPSIADFLDRVTVIYGKTNSGKSTIVKDILYMLRDKFPMVLIVCPTEPSNHAYSSTVSPVFIRTDLSSTRSEKLTILDDISELQEMRTSIYEKASNIRVLRSLYAMRPSERRDRQLEEARKKMSTMLSGTDDPAVREKLEKSFDAMFVQVYKAHINQNKAAYVRMSLNEDQRYAVRYNDLDPRILLIMDDCAADLKAFHNKPIFKKIFYQGRHINITTIICCQDDTDLPAALRKNVTISIFTKPTVLTGYFEKKANGYTKQTQKRVMEIANKAFIGHAKVIYIEADKASKYFYSYTATPRSFVFGSPFLHSLCERVKSSGNHIDKTNPFYETFKL